MRGAYLQPGRRHADWPGTGSRSLAEGDAQSPQCTLNPRPLGDEPAVSGKAPQKVQECMRGGALATIGFDDEGGEVIAAGLAQGILGNILCCMYLRS